MCGKLDLLDSATTVAGVKRTFETYSTIKEPFHHVRWLCCFKRTFKTTRAQGNPSDVLVACLTHVPNIDYGMPFLPAHYVAGFKQW